MIVEKEIYENWIARFGYPVSPLEKSVNFTFSKIRKLTKVSQQVVARYIKNSKLVMVGDDASIGTQQEMFLQLIVPAFKGKKVLIVTNRTDKYMLQALQSRNITIHKIKDGSLSFQNKAMFKAVSQKRKQYDHVIVWTGHLRVGSKSFQNLFSEFDAVSVYLQSNGLKWKFPNATGWNKYGTSLVWMESSPLISIDHYRSSEEKDFVLIRPEMLESVFLQMMKIIAKTMKQSRYETPKKIHHVFNHANMAALNRIKNIKLRRFIKDRVMNGESAAIPSEKMILLSTLNSSHMAEEAAHYLRTAHQDINDYGPAMTMIEEALAFFASLLLFPNRRIPGTKKANNVWDQVHASGYALGFKIWKLWNKSKKSRPVIQKLWKLHPKSDFEAQMMFQVMMDLK